ncbi:hypothetical protein EYF80_019524 [Liparis tanakae]|uniref:Uncharacterized protein n=1 Tax=Liparis tanakae TaxID=230148 RepID=A0A4Z2HXQ9_9TELE|nr:hypothetical protein EYF80_019524 [Liparis tanakae]
MNNVQSDCRAPVAPLLAGRCYCTLQAGQQASLRSGRGQKSICLTISAKSSSTMVLLLADVSMKGQPQSSASAWPSLGDTSLSSSRSTLLPTSTTGTCWYLETSERGIFRGALEAAACSPRWARFVSAGDDRNFLLQTKLTAGDLARPGVLEKQQLQSLEGVTCERGAHRADKCKPTARQEEL